MPFIEYGQEEGEVPHCQTRWPRRRSVCHGADRVPALNPIAVPLCATEAPLLLLLVVPDCQGVWGPAPERELSPWQRAGTGASTLSPSSLCSRSTRSPGLSVLVPHLASRVTVAVRADARDVIHICLSIYLSVRCQGEREREVLHLSSPEADAGAARTCPGRFH